MNNLLEEVFFISYGDCNAEKEWALTDIVSRMIQIATDHANNLKIGNPYLSQYNGGWVLVRLTIEMLTYPKANDTVRIQTWIENFTKHFSTRCFKFLSPEGKIYGYARTVWMIMETSTHIGLPLSELKITQDDILGETVPISKEEKHFQIIETGKSPQGNSRFVYATSHSSSFRFNYCDLDSYRHVNTTRYVAVLLNQFSLKDHDEYFINRLELSFLNEARYDEKLSILRNDNEEKQLSSFFIVSENEDRPVLFSRVFRRNR